MNCKFCNKPITQEGHPKGIKTNICIAQALGHEVVRMDEEEVYYYYDGGRVGDRIPNYSEDMNYAMMLFPVNPYGELSNDKNGDWRMYINWTAEHDYINVGAKTPAHVICLAKLIKAGYCLEKKEKKMTLMECNVCHCSQEAVPHSLGICVQNLQRLNKALEGIIERSTKWHKTIVDNLKAERKATAEEIIDILSNRIYKNGTGRFDGTIQRYKKIATEDI